MDSYTSNIVGCFDYYPFGMLMPGRNGGQNYRYSFNGMEKDDEVKGSGNSYDFGARMLDARLGRWLSIDPLFYKYPFLSPYVFVANKPIVFVDPNGKEIAIKDPNTGKLVIFKPGDPVPDGASTFVQDVYASFEYLSKSKTASDLIQKISDFSETVTIVQGVFDDHNDFYYVPYDNELHYNPYSALQTKNGTQSPAIGLIHELGHTEMDFFKPFQAFFLHAIPSLRYDNLEEKKVITGLETDVLNELGEKGVRENHGAEAVYHSQGPTTAAPLFYDVRPQTELELNNVRSRNSNSTTKKSQPKSKKGNGQVQTKSKNPRFL